MHSPTVTAFFDNDSNTVSYVVSHSGRAVIIDPVLDFDLPAGRTSTASADRILEHIGGNNLAVDWILETHVHADHLSAARYLRQNTGAGIAIGARVTEVQAAFRQVYNLPDLATDGRQFDRLFSDGDRFDIGGIEAKVLETPGHTPACVTYVIGDTAFVGDTLFMPDFGTARTDFPGGSAAKLYESVQKIFALPEATRLFMCHDYKAPGRDHFAWETTVREQRNKNVHVNYGVGAADFISLRETRDGQLGIPRLMLPSIQVNIRAGDLPEAESNGTRYLKIPLDKPFK